MDVHRCRFVPYQPSSINAVAFSHPKTRSAKHALSARLAIGRANGDIEIWNPLNGSWHQELVIHGGKDRSIDGLVWVNEPDQDLGNGRIIIGRSRLFSIGYTSTVTEWDLEKGKPKRHASGQHGDIWCIAVQPAEKTQGSGLGQDAQYPNKLIAGTINGELVVYSVEDDDLHFQRVMVKSPTKRAQMVSITFQSRRVVVVGCSDSTIRAYDMASGNMIRRMTLGADLNGGSNDIIVWSVKCLPGGDIVSGDSTGQICIWDGKTYTQTQRLQSHKQDVLSLATSADGTSIMSGGMDRRTILHKKTGQRWSKIWGRRYHDHDVKSMASFEHGRMSVIVSGGPDSNLVVVPLKEMGRENHRRITSLPQQPALASAPRSRLLISWWEREVHIWSLRKAASDLVNAGGEDINQNRKLLKTIVIKGDSNIASAAINDDGTMLIVSTATDVKAFRLEHQDPIKPSDIRLSSLELSPRLTSLGATHVRLSPDGKWLCLIQEGTRVLIVQLDITNAAKDLPVVSDQPHKLRRLHRNIPRWVTNAGLGRYDRTITQVAFAADSAMVATADIAGYIDTWVMQGSVHDDNSDDAPGEADDASSESSDEEDPEPEAGKSWIRNRNARLLPKLPSSPVVLSFSPPLSESIESGSNGILLAITSTWNLLAFDPVKGSLAPWSKQHPRKALPAPVQDLLDLAKGVLWQGSRVWVYGVSFLFMLDMSQDLSENIEQAVPGSIQVQNGVKRKRMGVSSGAGCKMARGNLAPHHVQKHANGQWEDMEMTDAPGTDDNNSDDELDERDTELAQLRNNGAGASEQVAGVDNQRKSWWITHKYRPIFGIVPFSAVHEPLEELAVVERPTWDVAMSDSYFKGEEWER